MSTIHYCLAELSNVLAALTDRREPETRAAIATILHKCSVANTYACLADNYPESETAVITVESLLASSGLGFRLDRAIMTLKGMHYNCNGFLGDKLAAQILPLLATLVSGYMQQMDDQARDLASANEKISTLQAALTKSRGPAPRKTRTSGGLRP